MEAERKQAKLAEKKAMMQHGGHAGHMMMGGHDMHMMMGGPPPDMEGGVYEVWYAYHPRCTCCDVPAGLCT